jgi:hypothetical protein
MGGSGTVEKQHSIVFLFFDGFLFSKTNNELRQCVVSSQRDIQSV